MKSNPSKKVATLKKNKSFHWYRVIIYRYQLEEREKLRYIGSNIPSYDVDNMPIMSVFISFAYIFSCSKEEDFSFSTSKNPEEETQQESSLNSGETPNPSIEPSNEPSVNEPSSDTDIPSSEMIVWDVAPTSLEELGVGIHSIPMLAFPRRFVLMLPSHVVSSTIIVLLHDSLEAPNESVDVEEWAASFLGVVGHPILLPLAQDGMWDVENEVERSFLQAMIEYWRDLASQSSLDIFLVGRGDGGQIALQVAVQETAVQGVGILLSSTSDEFVLPPNMQSLSFLQLVNKRDFLVPYTGGNGFMAVPSSVSFWRQHNNCSQPVQNSTSGDVSILQYGGCSDGAIVTLATVMPSPWHEECEASWQQAVQNDTEMQSPEGISCGSTHDLPGSAFTIEPWLFSLSQLQVPL